MDVLQLVRRTIDKHRMLAPGERLVVGVSGGPDSLCLLHVLLQLAPDHDLHLHVAHLDHRLRGSESAADAEFVARIAGEWGLPATIEACDVRAHARRHRLAIEEAARQCRYGFLARVCQETGATKAAVGHNADDQVETVVMHWLRGSGLAGLRGMLPVSPWPSQIIEDLTELSETGQVSQGLLLLRPLLEVPRSAIEAYCREHGLKPRFDRSNLDQTYYRNRLRHELIPLLETYNPGIREVLRRTAEVIAADYELLREIGQQAWAETVREADGAFVFDLERWSQLPLSLQRHLLREAIRRLRRRLRNINWVHIENALEVVNEKPAGSAATLPQGLMLFKSYDHFTVGEAPIEPDLPLLTVDQVPLTVPGVTPLPGSPWRLVAEVLPRGATPSAEELGRDRWEALLDFERAGADLVARRRRPGDRFQPLGMGGRYKRLNEFMINAKIPRNVRDRLPIIASPTLIVWVAGWRPDERVRVTEATRQVLCLTFRREG